MGANTDIEWAHATFNPWWGCTRVSEACRNCYAERFAKRQRVDWGPTAVRRPASERSWAEPIAWNRAAVRKDRRRRVFCASMADVGEDRPELEPLRARLCDLIEQTPMLDWMLLTKRPENMVRLLPSHWLKSPRPNVWLGTTAETQADADKRVEALVQVPAVVHFVSCEPLLERVVLERWLAQLDWVIAGGESGHGSRPMHPDWARALRDECVARSVAFFFKQWGEYAPERALDETTALIMLKLGKRESGRRLDGREWNEFPKQARLFRETQLQLGGP